MSDPPFIRFASHASPFGELRFIQSESSAPERQAEDIAQWRSRLSQALDPSTPLSLLDSFHRALDAMSLGDEDAFRQVLAQPTSPMPWKAQPGCRWGRRDLENHSGQPLCAAVSAAFNGEKQWLLAALPMATPLAKIRALEMAAVCPSHPEAFLAVLQSIDIQPGSGSDWPEAKRLDGLTSFSEARSLKDALALAALRPFGNAFELAVAYGFVHAIHAMGSALNASPENPGPVDRLNARRHFQRGCQLNRDPIPALLAAMDYAPLASVQAGLARLRKPRDLIDRPRGDSQPIIDAVEEKIASRRLRFELEACSEPSAARSAARRV